MPNLEVALQPLSSASTAQSVTTDEEGRYRITGLTPGQYAVIPLNSAYVIRSDNRSGSANKTVTLKEGEALDGVDFALVRGGIITGKVTTAEDRPVIAKQIDLALLDEQRRRRPLPDLNYTMFETDDRGVYRLETSLPGEHWYIKSITAPNPAAARQTLDAGRNGFALKAGEKATGLTITIAEGAASLRGQIKTEDARLPASLRVHLVPAEREQADNVLRYAEAAARKDGQFMFSNLAPGRYWIIAHVAAESDTTEAPSPAAWDNSGRAKLRREAEAAKVEIDLKPCQHVNEFKLQSPASTTNK